MKYQPQCRDDATMSHYRRADTVGAMCFFTVATYQRQTILCDDRLRQALRDAVVSVRAKRPFRIKAWVLLPDHAHCIWTLPPGGADFSMRWDVIKRQVSAACGSFYKCPGWINSSKRKHWDRRFGSAATGGIEFGMNRTSDGMRLKWCRTKHSFPLDGGRLGWG